MELNKVKKEYTNLKFIAGLFFLHFLSLSLSLSIALSLSRARSRSSHLCFDFHTTIIAMMQQH